MGQVFPLLKVCKSSPGGSGGRTQGCRRACERVSRLIPGTAPSVHDWASDADSFWKLAAMLPFSVACLGPPTFFIGLVTGVARPDKKVFSLPAGGGKGRAREQ